MAIGRRERLERLALEAKITAREKAEEKVQKKKRASKKTTPKKSAGDAGRMKMVWRVLDPASKVVATFAYPNQDDAKAKAAKLTEKSGKEYRVHGAKVPMDE